MRRDLPEVIEPSPLPPLPATAAEVIAALGPLVTERRRARIEEVARRRTGSLIPVLEDLADPHNGAAILRSADAFGCQEVHVIEDRRSFAISHRVSRGTHRWLSLVRHRDAASCARTLKARGFEIYVAAMEGELDPEGLRARPRAAVVFGNEHRGVSPALRALADGSYRVPMVGFVESLNVSVAAAVTLYAASRGRHGDLGEEARQELLARALMSTIKDAEGAIRRHLEVREERG